MIKKLSLISMIIFITASCHAAANGLDDEYLQQAVAHLQQTERNRALHAVEIARRELIGSLLINQDVWHQDREMSAEQKKSLDFGFSDNNIRKQINAGRLNQLMDPRQPWHAGSFIEWIAIKHTLANIVTKLAVTDMETFESYTLKDDFPIWLAAMSMPIAGATCAAGTYCSPVAGAGVFCCGVGIPCATKIVSQSQKVNRGERFFKAIDWLGCSKAWQQHIVSAMPQPMTMTDVADITARVYEYPPKPKQD